MRQFKQIAIIIFCINTKLISQSVTSIVSEQQGNSVMIYYNLESSKPCEIKIFVSQDGGKKWIGPLLNVSGDVGKDIKSGSNTITWDVLEEMEQLSGSAIKFKIQAKNSIKAEPELVFIKWGSVDVIMPKKYDGGKPIQRIFIDNFWISKHEITQEQWKTVMDNNPSNFHDCDKCPVENVSYDDALLFISKLNLLTGKQYRLPRWEEYEYLIENQKLLRETYSSSAWYIKNSLNTTHPVGTKLASDFGIHDLFGNVGEWSDGWYKGYSSQTDSGIGQFRNVYGGGWQDDVFYSSIFVNTELRLENIGFRIALTNLP
jgi:formylglycine-generating enzyme required for sulfatase activity